MKIGKELIGPHVGTVLWERDKKITCFYDYPIYQLNDPLESGATHIILDGSLDLVATLSLDKEGGFLIERKFDDGRADMFFNKRDYR